LGGKRRGGERSLEEGHAKRGRLIQFHQQWEEREERTKSSPGGEKASSENVTSRKLTCWKEEKEFCRSSSQGHGGGGKASYSHPRNEREEGRKKKSHSFVPSEGEKKKKREQSFLHTPTREKRAHLGERVRLPKPSVHTKKGRLNQPTLAKRKTTIFGVQKERRKRVANFSRKWKRKKKGGENPFKEAPEYVGSFGAEREKNPFFRGKEEKRPGRRKHILGTHARKERMELGPHSFVCGERGEGALREEKRGRGIFSLSSHERLAGHRDPSPVEKSYKRKRKKGGGISPLISITKKKGRGKRQMVQLRNKTTCPLRYRGRERNAEIELLCTGEKSTNVSLLGGCKGLFKGRNQTTEKHSVLPLRTTPNLRKKTITSYLTFRA